MVEHTKKWALRQIVDGGGESELAAARFRVLIALPKTFFVSHPGLEGSLFPRFVHSLVAAQSSSSPSSTSPLRMADAVATAAPAADTPQAAPKQKIKDWSTKKVLRVLRLANLCNGLILIAGAILVFSEWKMNDARPSHVSSFQLLLTAVTGLVSVSFTTVRCLRVGWPDACVSNLYTLADSTCCIRVLSRAPLDVP